jgi:hypothetical protein
MAPNAGHLARPGRGLRYVPYEELAGRPNVIVDGSPTEGTVLSLSHWPHLPVPPGLEADLSAEMVMAYLGRFDLHGPADLVSNNHFDQDGLVSVFALIDPDAAQARRDLLVDVAAAGDFATYRSRAAAQISMVIAAFADTDRSPLTLASGDNRSAALYDELLGRLPELMDHPERYRDLWSEEDSTLTATEQLVGSGQVQIEEAPELDLAVVSVPDGAPRAGGHRFGGMWMKGLHPMAINNATARFAVLCVRGRSYEFAYRYETWVQYRSRRPRPRVDLRPLAAELTAEEPGGARWIFEGVELLIPRLYLVGADESTLSSEEFRTRLEAHLRTAPPAWDPYTQPTTEHA